MTNESYTWGYGFKCSRCGADLLFIEDPQAEDPASVSPLLTMGTRMPCLCGYTGFYSGPMVRVRIRCPASAPVEREAAVTEERLAWGYGYKCKRCGAPLLEQEDPRAEDPSTVVPVEASRTRIRCVCGYTGTYEGPMRRVYGPVRTNE